MADSAARIDFDEAAAPATPAAAQVSLYAKSDGLLYSKDDAGVETLVSGGTGGAGGALHVINETVVTGSVAANIDFTSISGSYRHLQIMMLARGDTAATAVTVNLRFNNDSGSNYDWQRDFAVDAAEDASAAVAQTSARAGVATAASATSGNPGTSTIWIPNYAGTTFNKSGTGSSMILTSTAASGFIIEHESFLWRSTAAITRITLTPSAGNWEIGTVATLYGMDTA